MAKDLTIADIVKSNQAGLLSEWLAALRAAGTDRRTSEDELRGQTNEFLQLFTGAIGNGGNVSTPEWAPVRQFLDGLSRARATQGFSSSETAAFVFSLKQPLFARIGQQLSGNPQAATQATWQASELVDALGLHTVQAYQKSREDVIRRQQEELLELSTPVVKLWDGVVALPMIGTLDSARTQIVMESLLQRIVETGATVAIIDITGVPTVDTLVAQHLLKAVTAIRLMGADCIISGIRPQIAQTIVHLGIELRGITTKASLADALAVAFERTGLRVVKQERS